ncbi:DNA lyase [Methanoplanus sp. FWC-SCC4]|uniref:DNA-(apurinic or apyrimidinic site) lyase n=1 Tax=Methanochimaera problematica TaxID=2609417 RepID=A0AA97FD42_9EURY|nr:DNA glycosylase [Methanoplanus sp. FWC-SCC4]WOF15261.1 DNA lyase [Methanoplanus sp. FWC-SCC4]
MKNRFELCDIPFSLDETLSCGQVFRWKKVNDFWEGVCHGRFIKVLQNKKFLEYSGCDEEFLKYYFQLDLDLDLVLDSVCTDEHIEKAINERYGLRLVRQEPWECLLSYICAQNANIGFISRMLENMSAMCGEKIGTDEGSYSYPSAESLSQKCVTDIGCCSTGYRAPYICETSFAVMSDPKWSKRIQNLGYPDARKEIMKYKGVGPKVADCILLFAFQKFESFPVDVWIRRIMNGFYGIGNPEKPMSSSEYASISSFARDHFGEYAGYAQEYLFAGRK